MLAAIDETEVHKAFCGYYRSVKRHGWLRAVELATNSTTAPAGPFSQAELIAWCLVWKLFDPKQRAEAHWFSVAQALKDLKENEGETNGE